MSKELVSIVITSYNREKVLSYAIESALSQTYQSIEVIVIDDGSSDNTEELILKYQDLVKYYKKSN